MNPQKRYAELYKEIEEKKTEEFIVYALQGLVAESKDRMPQWVVEQMGYLGLMHYLGEKNGHHLFFDFYFNNLFLTNSIDKLPPVVENANLIDEKDNIIFLLGKLKKEKDLKAVIPPWVFVLRCQVKWAAGGYEDDWQSRTHICRANSLDEALDDFKQSLLYGRENCFEIIEILSKRTGWQYLQSEF